MVGLSAVAKDLLVVEFFMLRLSELTAVRLTIL